MPLDLAEFFTIVYPIAFRSYGTSLMFLKLPTILKPILVAIAAVLLSQCSKAIESQELTLAPKEQPTALKLPFTLPATSYLALASNQAEEEKQNLLIMAQDVLSTMANGGTALALWRKLIIYLRYSQCKGNIRGKNRYDSVAPRSAIARLAGVRESSSLSAYYQVQYHETLALAYESVGSKAESVC